ncbi:DUF1684 domain-containing protein [Natronomonas gomsonensis]|jgi:uncharacterized protein (DUF1684 family)|uniref:DUF1684 domain-containing protein n=1 Tax=Natronomonas gomsonensis TaxID=1046043 RepID=UPI0020CA530B|nr:DUF1684 domain-containing protein [Natronomonas gomsonensis]MCY4729592.1 DUF1684 domain-containing protein [Natronomonas gomsonensis]
MEFDTEAWREELQSYRAEKDEQFATSRQSPLPPEERENFDGLAYFDPDPAYRVEATVELVDSDETVAMETTAEGEQLYERAARLHFEVPDASGDVDEHTLVAYQRVDHEGNSLFVPFRDKTTGQQTYPAGRYMELHAEGELEDGDTVPLDFNLAYSPFCAYSEAYECPLPPEENWLEIAIAAGERYGG